MREHRYLKCILCEGETMAESVEIFNAEMKKQAFRYPTYERDGNRFLIYVKYTEREPESLAEEMELKGHDHRCIECSHCERAKNRFGDYDGRMKKAMCNKKGQKVFLNSMVCDTFYKEHQGDVTFAQIAKINNNETADIRGA